MDICNSKFTWAYRLVLLTALASKRSNLRMAQKCGGTKATTTWVASLWALWITSWVVRWLSLTSLTVWRVLSSMERTISANRTSSGVRSTKTARKSVKWQETTMGTWTSTRCATGTFVRKSKSSSRSQEKSPTLCLHRLASVQMADFSSQSRLKKPRPRKSALKICRGTIANFARK